MDTKKVKDLMVPLDEYAVVDQDATLLDAVLALDKAISKLKPGKQKHRAVLVVDSDKKVIGKIGHLAFLKALEPKYNVLGDLPALSRVGVSQEFIDSMMANMKFFQDNLADLSTRAARLKARDVMHPVTESVAEDATLAEGIHELVMHQSLSILVTRKGNVVGILRISDLFEELTKEMKKISSSR
jgi:CBS domain-containing protein